MTSPTKHHAELTTASVAVQTMIVAGQRLTLALFRQLRERPLISEEDGVTLNGKPWGVVEYHPAPKTCPKSEHLHVVWSEDSTLLRDTITAPDWEFTIYNNPRHGTAYLNAMVRDRVMAGPTDFDGSRDRAVTIGGVRVRLAMTDNARHAINVRQILDGVLRVSEEDWESVAYTVYLPRREGPGIERISVDLSAGVRYHWHQLDEAIAHLGDEPTDRAHLRLAAEVDEERRLRQAKSSAYQRVSDLPQLFIATR